MLLPENRFSRSRIMPQGISAALVEPLILDSPELDPLTIAPAAP
jgi:hypothetical protein